MRKTITSAVFVAGALALAACNTAEDRTVDPRAATPAAPPPNMQATPQPADPTIPATPQEPQPQPPVVR